MSVTTDLIRLPGTAVGAGESRVGFAGAALAVALLATAASASAQSASFSEEVREYVSVDAPVVALVGARVIDGSGAHAREGQTVVIRDGRIAAVGPSDEVEVPAEAEVLELEGHTVIPGMIGLHNHLFYTAAGGRRAELTFSAPRLYLGSGVTTIRTTGSTSPYGDINLKHAIEEGRVPGPSIHITAPYITGSGGADHMAAITTPEEARRFVSYWAEEGATWIKAYTDIHRAELSAAIQEAHERGLEVTGHLCSVTFREAVEMGIDNLEHGFDTATDFDPRKKPDECPSNSMIVIGDQADPTGVVAQDVIRTMVDNDVSMTSTLAVIEPFIPNRPTKDRRTLDALAPSVREAYLEARNRIDAAGANFPFQEKHLKKAMEFERKFVEMGGTLAAGVDPTGIGGALPGFGDQRNYELLTEAGFSPEEAVGIVSANGAKVLGIYESVGSVEEGKRADLVVLDGDLTADPSVIRNVVTVFKDGVGYDSEKLTDSVKGRVGID